MADITIKINENEAVAMVTELEAKGCYEIAKMIEDAYTKAVAKDTIKKAKKDLGTIWKKGYYFKHSDGRVEALYFNTRTREFYTHPIYIGGMLMGHPTTMGHLRCLTKGLADRNFQEVV